ncbi:hypothetical protein DFH09DRAFT_1103688 [Mycena vulgaris]|nr:hypothetical protein DFH09DRAFT_1103688 [Mycena vulgaris]
MVQNTVERGRDKAAQSVQNSESYEEIGREDQNLPKRVIFLFAPSVLQTAVTELSPTDISIEPQFLMVGVHATSGNFGHNILGDYANSAVECRVHMATDGHVRQG